MVITNGLMALEFKCVYENIGTIYNCKVENIAGDGDVLTAANCGGGQCNTANSTVERLRIGSDSEPLKSFPKNMKDLLGDLKSIEIRESAISSISVKDLMNFTKLVNLDLRGNEIQSLKHNLFAYTPNLARVDFSENNISHVEFGIFRSLINLNEARFDKNPCIQLDAGTNLQFSLAYLELQLAVSCGLNELLQISIIEKVHHIATNSSAYNELTKRITGSENSIADIGVRVDDLEHFKDVLTISQKSMPRPRGEVSRRNQKTSRKSNVS